MDKLVNKATWRYKMGLPRPQCCDNNDVYQLSNSNYLAFNSYVIKHNIDRNKIGGYFHPLTSYTIPTWLS